jgi:hypothetical protein
MHIFMYAEQVCTSVIYTCPYTILQIAILDQICIYLYICVYICIYVYIFVYICICIFIYIYMIYDYMIMYDSMSLCERMNKQPLMPFLGITLSSVQDPRANLLGE